MENTDNFRRLTLNESSISNLEIIRKWSLFFSILGFIYIGILALLIVGLIFVPFALPGGGAMGLGKMAMIPVIILCLAMAVLYFFPILYLYRFSTLSKMAIKNLDSEIADSAFKYLRMHIQFIGILTIIALALYLLFGFLGLLGALFI